MLLINNHSLSLYIYVCVCDNLLSFSCMELYVNIDRYQNLDRADKINKHLIQATKAISELPQDTS